MSAPYLHIALDQFRDGLPDRFRGLNAPEGTAGNAGLNVVPVNDVPKPYTEIRFGDEGKKMLRGMRRAMAALAQAGNNIIVDDIILSAEFLADYLQVFEPYNVIFVGVLCPQAVIHTREASRPGRFPGTAAGHFVICHAHGHYDITVDTSIMTPAACARLVADFVTTKPGKVFAKLRACGLRPNSLRQ